MPRRNVGILEYLDRIRVRHCLNQTIETCRPDCHEYRSITHGTGQSAGLRSESLHMKPDRQAPSE